ncbi:hypothetical protein D3C87_1473420 [compost metagenome]
MALQLQQFARQMLRTAAAARGVAVLARRRLDQIHQLPDVAGRQRRVDVEHQRHGRHLAHRGQRAGGVQLELVQAAIDDDAGVVAEQRRAAIALGAAHELGADIAAGAAPVVHDHRHAKALRQARCDDAREDVRGTARRVGRDDAQRGAGVGGGIGSGEGGGLHAGEGCSKGRGQRESVRRAPAPTGLRGGECHVCLHLYL